MDYSPGEVEDTEKTQSPNDMHKNIEDQKLLNEIFLLEKQLHSVRASESESIKEELGDLKAEIFRKKSEEGLNRVLSAKKEEIALLDNLSGKFNALLNTRYGPISYLVSSTSASIEGLYHLDEDEDFYRMLGSAIRAPNPMLDGMVAAGGGKRWIGERGSIIYDPSETDGNEKIASEAIRRILSRISSRKTALQDELLTK
jgi:hypothetical protein